MHVDNFVAAASGLGSECRNDYARFFFLLARLPAVMQFAFGPWISQFKLFCTFQGQRYRVTGASRLGDVWLALDFGRSIGYDKRVDVEQCSNWSPEP